MRAALPAFVQHLASKNRSSRTIRSYEGIVAALSDHLAPTTPSRPPTQSEMERFLARARQDGSPRAPSTRNQELAALRAFCAVAKRELGWEGDPCDGIPFVREPPRMPVVLTATEVQSAFTMAASRGSHTERTANLAILALLSQTGLRVHELVALDFAQVDLTTGTLMQVRGKGGTVRELPLNDRALALLRAWMSVRESAAKPGVSALFVSTRGTRMSVRAVERRVQQLRVALGLSKRATPHSFRHSFATLELMAGTDLATVAELLGHSDLNNTRRYLHFVDTRRREAVRRLAYTVPETVLPVEADADVPVRSIAERGLPPVPEGASTSPPKELDGQYGLGVAA